MNSFVSSSIQHCKIHLFSFSLQYGIPWGEYPHGINPQFILLLMSVWVVSGFELFKNAETILYLFFGVRGWSFLKDIPRSRIVGSKGVFPPPPTELYQLILSPTLSVLLPHILAPIWDGQTLTVPASLLIQHGISLWFLFPVFLITSEVKHLFYMFNQLFGFLSLGSLCSSLWLIFPLSCCFFSFLLSYRHFICIGYRFLWAVCCECLLPFCGFSHSLWYL